MSKNERKRTMVYSNVNKKADSKSASRNNEKIDLDNEIVIGLENTKKINNSEKKKKNKKIISGQVIDKIAKKQVEQEPITMQDKINIQKRKVIKKISVFFLLLVLIIGAIVYFFLSPIFNVKSIQVINNNYISSEQIINASGINLNENMFKFSKKEVKQKILTNPYVESVDISRNIFLDKVQISVKERIATLMLEYGNSYVYINNQGYILEISPIKIDSPILKGYITPLEDVKPGNRLNKDDLERLDKVLKIIEIANANGLGNLITHIDIKDKKDYVMYLESEDKTVYLGTCSDLSTQMLYVKEMIKREKGVEGEFFIDMDLNKANPVFREKV